MWRKKWERDWDNIKFCSDACRTHKPGASDAALEQTILRLLHERGAGKTICPSEAARTIAGEGDMSNEREKWEPLMEPARAAARRLAAAGSIVITQGGHIVDASTEKVRSVYDCAELCLPCGQKRKQQANVSRGDRL